MKEHNIYKTIVFAAILCLLSIFFAGWIKDFFREQKSYALTIQSNSDLTGDIVKEFENILGICRFEPMQTVTVTIRLNQYSMEATLVGLDLDRSGMLSSYPAVRWKTANSQFALGNTPVLFFGTDAFSSFSDHHGFAPEKSQIETWINEYSELALTVTDETGRTTTAVICGILETPKDQIYIVQNQIQELFGSSAHILGGYMEICGYQNTKKAQKLLEEAGFMVAESADQNPEK